MRIALVLLLVLALITPSLGHVLRFNVTMQPTTQVVQLSGASPDIFEQIRAGANLTPFSFTWNNPKYPKINVTDENIQKDIYTDAAYSYLHNWSTIIPALPRAG